MVLLPITFAYLNIQILVEHITIQEQQKSLDSSALKVQNSLLLPHAQ